MVCNWETVPFLCEELLRVLPHSDDKFSSDVRLKNSDPIKKLHDIILQLLLEAPPPHNQVKPQLSRKTVHWIQEFKDNYDFFIRNLAAPTCTTFKSSVGNLKTSCEKLCTYARLQCKFIMQSISQLFLNEIIENVVQKFRAKWSGLLDVLYIRKASDKGGSLLQPDDSCRTVIRRLSEETCLGVNAQNIIRTEDDPGAGLLHSPDSSQSSIIEAGDCEGGSFLYPHDSFQSTSWRSDAQNSNQRDHGPVCSKASIIKWVPIVLNVVVEACQAALTQESAQHKIRRKIYLTLSLTLSSFCFIMSLGEPFLNWVSQNRGAGRRISNPGAQLQFFERFFLYFGIVCSTAQLLLSITTMVTKKDLIEFDLVPLLLSVGYMVAVIIDSREKNLNEVKCTIHGREALQVRLVHGVGWVPECRECMENAV